MSKKNRKLAAILFADIVGYTALMQKDEQQAATLIRHFQQQLEEKVIAHNGQIVNFYGDGALCTFQIPIDAVRCAMDLQTTFQNAPKTPVRIGIHSGTVTYEGEKIFGDSVNITSRIESMGVAGGILLSKKVRDEVKNNPDLQMQSLGSFEFKNVEEAMEVFALANEGLIVPKKSEIQGKFKTGKLSFSKPVLITLSILMLLVVTSGLWWFQHDKELLPDALREARTAVLPFENLSNNKELDNVGRMAADWITEGLIRLPELKVVSYNNVKQNLPLASANAGNNRFSLATGAEKLITGSIYQEGAKLIIKSNLKDARTGEIEYVFESVVGNQEQPSNAVNLLMQRILAYYTIRESMFYGGLKFSQPPSLDAWNAFEKGLELFGKDYDKALAYFREANRLDSNFIQPYWWSISSYSNRGQYEEGDSVLTYIRDHFSPFDTYEQLIYDWNTTIFNGNLQDSKKILKRYLEIDPKDPTVNYLASLDANSLNQPQEAIAIAGQISPSAFDFNKPSWSWWITNYCDALIRLQRYPEALKILDYLPKENGSISIPIRRAKIYIHTNQLDSLNIVVQSVENRNFYNGNSFNLFTNIGATYGLKGDKGQQKIWYDKARQWAKSQPEGRGLSLKDMAYLHFRTNDNEAALNLYQQLLNQVSLQQNLDDYIFYKERIGVLSARLNKMEQAQSIVEELKAINSKYDHGHTDYSIANIMVAMGQEETAVDWLKRAFKNGFGFNYWSYDNDLDLVRLKGNAEFEAFVKPKG